MYKLYCILDKYRNTDLGITFSYICSASLLVRTKYCGDEPLLCYFYYSDNIYSGIDGDVLHLTDIANLVRDSDYV